MNPAFHQAMVPNGSMMPQVMQQQQQQQQPLSSPFNLNPTGIMQMYQSHQSQASGWKADVAPQERFGFLNELYASLPSARPRPRSLFQLHVPQARSRRHRPHGRPELVVPGHQPRRKHVQQG
jgi:hypothetical protein